MPAAFLLDLDGTLYTDAGPVAGGPAMIATLRRRGIPFRCVTNTTSRSRRGLVERLRAYGYAITPEEIITPVGAAAALCRSRGHRRVAPYMPAAALEDLDVLVTHGDGSPDAVVLGDLGEGWSFARLQQAFGQIMAGADPIALSRDRYYHRGGQLTLDAGLFVAGLEYVTGRTATVVGKPSAEFYHAAVASLALAGGADGHDIVMVGDDLWSDIAGAGQAGLTAWLVRTGKFREQTLSTSGITPDRVLGSVADLLD